MEKRPLGNTDLQVTKLCLGTMTWGEQNTEAEAHEQMDYAVAAGINFFDVAEMYPVPPKPETQGRTEECIGSWFARTGKRQDIILATKVAGPSFGGSHIRGGSRLNREHINLAIDSSLRRLQTDYVDLYQLHWPERNTNFFGKLGYQHQQDGDITPIEETLEVLHELIKQGKIRHYGLSNETPWGTMKFIAEAKRIGMPAPVSVQNPYNLLNRSYEVGMAEVSIREQCGLLAYSPLAFGVLTGKYLNGQKPPKGRLTLFERFQRYNGELADKAASQYAELAQQAGISPATLAMAFVTQQPFVTSNILGATTMEQLKENIDSAAVELSQELIDGINGIHAVISNPCP
ncbi:NADP(H)-dependent aldo-keto reductase [Oceanobacter mangrovi]|uniref:NADP(H)-dependent aldo-keto reductase n=1 Tax=Oceanobacter mangrovi TaxID=2862510 RepID=UPI001C8D5298|nr:NADP(H)-dependent aldo-keto reductase [Oceanobacter mangrovi]